MSKKNDYKGTAGDDIYHGASEKNKIEGKDGNDSLYGNGGKDDIKGGKGNDLLDGGAGDDQLKGEDGDDTLMGGAGKDKLDGGKGDDTVLGGLGEDDIKGGSGQDIVSGGAGLDKVDGGSGDDTLVFNMSANLSSVAESTKKHKHDHFDEYKGGSGIDTLQLEFTRNQWMQDDVQADIAAYLKFLSEETESKHKKKDKADSTKQEAGGKKFEFTAFSLSAKQIETLKILVDGVELDPTDELVNAIDDFHTTATEHSVITGNVSDNDEVPDIVRAITLIEGPTKGQLQLAIDGSYSYDPGNEFDTLAKGESEQVSFSYRVTDADHDADTATMTITITGTNDAPVAVADTAAGLENDVLTIDVLENDTDVDTSDSHLVDTATINSGLGSVSIVDNKLQWDPGSDYDFLAVDETAQIEIGYTISDSHGATSSSTVSLTVTGTNDSPVAIRDIASAHENEEILIQALSNDTDVDESDTHTITRVEIVDGLGEVSIQDNKIFWTPLKEVENELSGTNNQNLVTGPADVSPSHYDYLAAGESATVEIAYTMVDNHGAASSATATITVNGVNDAPTVGAALMTTFSEEDEVFTVDLLALAADVDNAATLRAVTITEIDGKGGWSVDGNVLRIDPNHFDRLNNGDTESLTLSYQIEDEHGAGVEQTLNYTVEGFTDAPSLDIKTSAGAHVNEIRLTISSMPANIERVELRFSSLPAGAVLLDAALQEVSAGIDDFSGTHSFTLILPKGEAVKSDLDVTVSGIGNDGAVIGATSTVIDLALTTHSSEELVEFKADNQSMWTANTDAVIGWHEYVPIVGGMTQVWNPISEQWDDNASVQPWSSGLVNIAHAKIDSAELIAQATAGPQQVLDAAQAVFTVASVAVDEAAQQLFSDAQGTFNSAVVQAEADLTAAFDTAQQVFNDVVETGDAAAKATFAELERLLEDAKQPDPDLKAALSTERDYWLNKAAAIQNYEKTIFPGITFSTGKREMEEKAATLQTQIDNLPPAADVVAREVFKAAQKVFDDAVALGDQAAANIFATAQSTFDTAVDGIDAVSKAILDAAQWAYDHRAFGLDPGNILLNALNGAKATFAAANADIVEGAQSILDAARVVFEDAQQVIENAAQTVLDSAKSIYEQAQAAFLNLAEEAVSQGEVEYNKAQAIVVNAAQTILDDAEVTATQIKDDAVTFAQGELNNAQATYNDVKQAIAAAAQSVLDLAQSEFDNAVADLNTIDFNAELEVKAELYGEIGLQIDFVLDTGSVDTQLNYLLTSQAQYNATTDVLYLSPQAQEVISGSVVPFSTISPNVSFYAALLYDVGLNLEIFVDGVLKVAGETVFDLSPDSNGTHISTSVGTGGWDSQPDDVLEDADIGEVEVGKIVIVDFNSVDAQPFEVPFIESLTEGIVSIELAFPTVQTEGAPAVYDPTIFQEGGFLTLDLSEITDSFLNLLHAKMDFSPEIRAAFDLPSLQGSTSLEQAINTVGSALMQTIFDALDGESEERPIFLIDANDETNTSLLHINIIPDEVIGDTLSDETATFGFYTAYGESDAVVKVNIDIDQAVAVVVNKIAEAALAAVTAGGTAAVTQAIPDINPLDLEFGVEELLKIFEVPKETIEKVKKFINFTIGFEAADIDIYTALKFSQEFSLSIDDMSYLVTLEDGAEYVFSANSEGSLKIENASQHDANGDGIVDYNMQLVPTAMFSNDTEIGLSVGFVLDFLKAKLEAGLSLPLAEILPFDIENLPTLSLGLIDINLGPLLRVQGDLDLVTADVFESRFNMNVGSDTVTGSFSVIDDVINGTAADDVIAGNQGNDILTGGGGNDLFIFSDSTGSDIIKDFMPGQGSDDVIDLLAIESLTSFADVLANSANDSNGNAKIDLGDGNSVTLVGVDTSQLHENDFLLS